MKLKTKLLSALASAVVASTSLSVVAACSYKAKAKQPVDGFTVRTEDGQTSWETDESQSKIKNVNFVLSRELDAKNGEVLDVTSDNPDVNAVIIEKPSTGMNFTIRFKMLNAVMYHDKSEKFSLLFTISNSHGSSGKFLLQNLTYSYNADWEPMTVSFGNEQAKEIISDIGNPKVNVTGLVASRSFNTAKHETIESIKLTGDQADIEKLEITDIEIIGKNINFIVGIKNPILTQDYGTLNFGIIPVVSADNINGTRDLNTISGFKFTYRPAWDENSVLEQGALTEHNKLVIDATSADKTSVDFKSNESQGWGLKLKRSLANTGETLSVTSSIPNYITVASTPTISATNWLDVRFSITAAGIQKYKEAKEDFVVSLTFVFVHPNGKKNQTLSTKFSIGYKAQETNVFTMPSEITGASGETAIIAAGSYTDAAKGKTIACSITNAVLSDKASELGYTSSDVYVHQVTKDDKTSSINIYFGLKIKPEHAYVPGISFDVSYTLSFTGLTTPETHRTNVIYSKSIATNDPEEFSRSRAVSIMERFNYGSTTYGTFASAWVVGDATPDNKSDYVYYIATSKTKAQQLIDLYNTYGKWNSFKFGVCDYQMATSQKSYVGPGGVSMTAIGADPMEDYVYLNASGVDWASDSFTWNDSPTDKTYGCDIQIATLDLSSLLQSDTDANVWRAFRNKCDKLNGYAYENDGKINSTVSALPTSIPQDIYIGGFSATKYYNYYWNGAQWVPYTDMNFFSYMNEEYEKLTPSNMNIISESSYRENHGSEKITSNKKIYRGSPQLASTITINHPIYINEFDGGIGSMLFMKDDTSIGENESPFKILGIYWGVYGDKPYFDFIVNEAGQNMLSDYNVKIYN